MMLMLPLLALTADPELRGMRIQLPRGRRLQGQPTDAWPHIWSASQNIGQAGNQVSLTAERMNHVAFAGVIVGAAWVVCTFDERLRPWSVAIIFLGWVSSSSFLDFQSRQSKEGSPSFYDYADHDLLRAFFYTSATDHKLLEHVLKKTEGRDISDSNYDLVRAAIERCRKATSSEPRTGLGRFLRVLNPLA